MLHLVTVQGYVGLILGIAAFAMELFAMIEAIRFRAETYPAAGKRTKGLWLGITIACVLVGFLSIQNPIGILGILAVVGAAVFLTDVRPALQKISGGGGGSNGTHMGPYGPY